MTPSSTGEGNQIAASHGAFRLKKYQGLESHDFVNNDQMFLNPPFSQLKGGPHHKALSTLESISQLAKERKRIQFLTYLIGDLAWQVRGCNPGDWTLIL